MKLLINNTITFVACFGNVKRLTSNQLDVFETTKPYNVQTIALQRNGFTHFQESDALKYIQLVYYFFQNYFNLRNDNRIVDEYMN